MERIETGAPTKGEAGAGYAGRIFREIQGVIDDTGGQAGAVIRVLQQTQGLIGYLPGTVLMTISRDLKMPLSEIYGIVSFYNFFTMVPKGRHVIQVCMGTCCYVRGGERILDVLKKEYGLEPGGTTPDNRFSLETVRCLGACALAPVMTVDNDIHRRLRPTRVKELLSAYL